MRGASWLLIAGLFLMPLMAQGAPLKNKLEISGWIPYWRAATGTLEAITHIDALTAVHPFGYIVQSDGSLHDAAGLDSPEWQALRLIAKEKKVRFIPTIMWHDGKATHNILSDTAARRALASRISNLAHEKNFDGIDIDFEGKLAETNPYFSLFLEGLYQKMGKKWVYCTIEPRTPLSSRYDGAPPPGAGIYANDYVAINKYCDRVQIMAYDQGSVDVKLNKAYSGPYAPVADIEWVEKVMLLAMETIARNKLVLGIPTYGYEYAVTPLSISGYRYDLQWAFNPRYANDLASALGITPMRTRGGELFFTYTPTTTPRISHATAPSQAAGPGAAAAQPFNILWWGDAVSLAQKTELAERLGIKGVAVFKFDGGADPRIWNVLVGP